MIDHHILNWLLEGDPSIQYQVNRDLLNRTDIKLQKSIAIKGWGKKFLTRQNSNGHWGRGFYVPKWTSTHYTLLDLKNLSISPNIISIQKSLEHILENEMSREKKYASPALIVSSDICINGMVLNYASYFRSNEDYLKSIVDYLLKNQLPDGGFNCQSTRLGSVHSSLHTTLSVLEGFFEYINNGYKYRLGEIKRIEKQCVEFILIHKLYKSDKTGKIIKNDFTKLAYPSRWRYDILRCMDYFSYAKIKYDERMTDALELLISKRKIDGKWHLAAKYPGNIHFEMEKPGSASRWNTLRALRVLKYFNQF